MSGGDRVHTDDRGQEVIGDKEAAGEAVANRLLDLNIA